MRILGIDAGLKGAICLLTSSTIDFFKTPLTPSGDLDFFAIEAILDRSKFDHAFLERAVSFGMGTKGAFNYGRSFAALEIALLCNGGKVTYVEPAKWTRVMHAGVDQDLKPKVKSVVAMERLFCKNKHLVPTNKKGAYDDGCVDALLIAAYGQRLLLGV